MIKKEFEYNGWELNLFDNSTNYKNYQFSLIKTYIGDKCAEVGPGNGIFVNHCCKYAKKIYLYEPSKNLFLNLKKKFKKY